MRLKFETITNCEGGHYRGGGDKDGQQEWQVHGGGAQGGAGEGHLGFQKMCLSLSSGGEVRQVCEGEGDAAHLVLAQEVNLLAELSPC